MNEAAQQIEPTEPNIELRQQIDLETLLLGMNELEKSACMVFYRLGNAHAMELSQ